MKEYFYFDSKYCDCSKNWDAACKPFQDFLVPTKGREHATVSFSMQYSITWHVVEWLSSQAVFG
jgi:hypothetical protein